MTKMPHVHGLKDIMFLRWFKMVIFSQLISRFNAIPIKIPADLFAYFDKLFLKFTQKFKGSILAKTVLKKNKFGGLTLPNFPELLKSYSNQDNMVQA